MNLIYLDNYRTTPVSDFVNERINEYNKENFFLPVSFTSKGTEAAENIEEAKNKIMNCFGCSGGEVVFTMGGTHANNLVISGLLRDEDLSDTEIVTSVIDHPSIVNVYEYYRKKGAKVHFVKVDGQGYIREDILAEKINEKTRLLSVTLVNHTIGTVQKIKKVIEIARNRNSKIKILLDACTAVNSIEINMDELGIDFLTFSGHKIYGPRGIGAIVSHKGVTFKPTIFGTVTTSTLMPGADNIPGILSLADALEKAVENRKSYVSHTMALQKKLIEFIDNNIPDAIINGPKYGERATDNVNYSFRFIEGESIMMFLDFENIIVATGSACASSDLKVNYILSAIGRDHELSHGSLRMTLGWLNDEKQIEKFCNELKPIVERLRNQSTIK